MLAVATQIPPQHSSLARFFRAFCARQEDSLRQTAGAIAPQLIMIPISISEHHPQKTSLNHTALHIAYRFSPIQGHMQDPVRFSCSDKRTDLFHSMGHFCERCAMLSVVCRHTFVIHSNEQDIQRLLLAFLPLFPTQDSNYCIRLLLRHSFAPTPCTSGKLADTERIEHSLMVLETIVLPLNYVSVLAGTLGVEPRHTESKSVALPLRYAPIMPRPIACQKRGRSHQYAHARSLRACIILPIRFTAFATDAHGCRVSTRNLVLL